MKRIIGLLTAVLLATMSIMFATPAAAQDDEMLGAFGPACGAVPTEGEGSFVGMADDPAGTAASNNPVLSTLVTAVVAADLVDTLNSDGPFTIFAPFNGAFDDIDPDTLNAVLADTDLLTSILTYHVIAGESLEADDLPRTATTVEGSTVAISADGLTIGGANAICSNIPVANGTVHVIDAVLLPQVALDALADASDDTPELAQTGLESWHLAIVAGAAIAAGGLFIVNRRSFVR